MLLELCLSGRIHLGMSWARLEDLISSALTVYDDVRDYDDSLDHGDDDREFEERWPNRGTFVVHMVQLWTGVRKRTEFITIT